MIIFAIPVLLFVLVLASSDLANAAEPEYKSKIGYNTKAGWVVMALLVGAAVFIAGVSGLGPLAMMAN